MSGPVEPTRRLVVTGLGMMLMAETLTGKPARAEDWPRVAPEAAGFAADLEARLDRAVAGGHVWNLHGVVVLRRGQLVLERYFEGHDNARGRDIGRIAFGPGTLHDVRSCSKSLVGLAYGIALAQGRVPPPEAPLFSAFPEYADLAGADGRDRLTIQHVLTMTMGTDWDESSLPYSDPANSEIAMDLAADRYRYILERRVVTPPGRYWTYSGGATALLARIIAKGTGRSVHDFAREHLFDPLGLGPTAWAATDKGEPFAASGARMTPRDLALIGTLMLSGGKAGGRQIVPAEWLARLTTPIVSADELRRYGYQWWIIDIAFGAPKGWAPGRLERMWSAMGEGGQRLFIIPALELVIAITAGNYLQPDQWKPPTYVLRDVVLASLV